MLTPERFTSPSRSCKGWGRVGVNWRASECDASLTYVRGWWMIGSHSSSQSVLSRPVGQPRTNTTHWRSPAQGRKGPALVSCHAQSLARSGLRRVGPGADMGLAGFWWCASWRLYPNPASNSCLKGNLGGILPWLMQPKTEATGHAMDSHHPTFWRWKEV